MKKAFSEKRKLHNQLAAKLMALAAAITFTAFCAAPMQVNAQDLPLKELYKDEFLIGVAAGRDALADPKYSNLITQQFNSLTMENEMKPDCIMDQQASRDSLADTKEKIALTFDSYRAGLDFAKKTGLKVRGHVLVWHSQTPDWIFYEDYDTSGELASRELMLKRMENYIKEVICWTETNYPGVVYAWDVVNEAVEDRFDGQVASFRGESLWYQTIGEDYVQKAFSYARTYTKQYAPGRKIKLFYNDYNEYFPEKRDGIIEMLKPIKEMGNIDGIGMQSHIDTNRALYGRSGYMTAVKKYADMLELEIQVTELDIARLDGDTGEEYATEEGQGEFYEKFMKELLAQKNAGANITCVAFWGLTDELSWRKGQKPLLYDGQCNPKPAFYGVVNASESIQQSVPAGLEIIRNGGFEEGVEGWEPYAYVGVKKLETSDDTAAQGQYSLKVDGRSNTASGASQDVSLRMKAGAVYQVKASIFYPAGKGNADNADAPDNAVFNLSIQYGDGRIEDMASATVSGNVWTRLEGSYTVPEDADLYGALVFVGTQWKPEPTAQDLVTYYLDGVSMKKAPDEEDKEKASRAAELIGAIGTVEYSDASKDLIQTAREAYDLLTGEQKELVENYHLLEAAEKAYRELAEKDEADKDKDGKGDKDDKGNENDEPEPPVKKPSLNVKKITLGARETFALKVSNGSVKKFTSSSKKTVAVTQRGRLTAKKKGTATVTAVLKDGKKLTCKVTVKNAPGKISLKKRITLKKGKSATIKVIFPKNTASHKLTYKSNRKSVVKVDAKGKVTAVKKGKAVVTVTTFNKKKAMMEVTVR